MYAVVLVCLATSADPNVTLNRFADDVTLAAALERSAGLAERLLDALPDGGRASPRARVRALLDDSRRDADRLRASGQGCVFEATVLYTYADLCQTAAGQFGAGQIRFRPHPTRGARLDAVKIPAGTGNGDGLAPGKVKV